MPHTTSTPSGDPLTIVFDLDGTLADTAGDLIAAANACFEARGLGSLLDPTRDAPIAFRGGRAMLRAGFIRACPEISDDDLHILIEEDFPYLLESYGANLNVHTRLYPGVQDALLGLRSAGHRLAICTNKPERLARTLMDEIGIMPLFDHLSGADTYPWRKPDPRPLLETVRAAGGRRERAVLVGDTETDRAAAAAAGIPCLLVTFGPDGDKVADLAPEGLLDGFERIETALDALGLSG